MNQIKLKIDKISDIKNFVNEIGTVANDYMFVENSTYRVNPKSLIGMLSIDTSKTFILHYPEDWERVIKMKCEKWEIE